MNDLTDLYKERMYVNNNSIKRIRQDFLNYDSIYFSYVFEDETMNIQKTKKDILIDLDMEIDFKNEEIGDYEDYQVEEILEVIEELLVEGV